MKSITELYKHCHIFEYFQKSRILSSVLLLIPTLIIFLFLLKDGVPYCCDSDYYMRAIKGFQEKGIFLQSVLDQEFLGYRSYLFPYFFSLFPVDLSKTVVIGNISLSMYSLLAIGIFTIIEFSRIMKIFSS